MGLEKRRVSGVIFRSPSSLLRKRRRSLTTTKKQDGGELGVGQEWVNDKNDVFQEECDGGDGGA